MSDIRKVKTLINFLIVASMVSIFFAWFLTGIWQKAALILAFVLTAIYLCIFASKWRCPHCGRHLGRVDSAAYCKYCGKALY